jgi:geranylgeranyl reductase family protein
MRHNAHYDAIVVGAGPGGTTAAWELARHGARVALLERRKLPRHKTCGGGMPITVRQLLQIDASHDLAPEAFVEARVRYLRHTFRFASPYLASLNHGPADEDNPSELELWMVQRSIFDNALAQRAARAGAELRDALTVRRVECADTGPIRITAEGETGTWSVTCDFLIGADGANGVVARQVGLRRERAIAIAIEVEAPHRWGEGHEDLRPDVAHLEFGVVQGGYAWVFPKENHLNVGAGCFRPHGQSVHGDQNLRTELRQTILDYLRYLNVPYREEELVFHAHPLPIWNGLDMVQNERANVLLVGDAAGLINPFFGDGIYSAIRSGSIAARAILEGRTMTYTDAIGEAFRANFDGALRFARFFYRWPGFCYRHGVLRPYASRTAVRILAGELTFPDISRRIIRRIRQAMAVERGGPYSRRLRDLEMME